MLRAEIEGAVEPVSGVVWLGETEMEAFWLLEASPELLCPPVEL